MRVIIMAQGRQERLASLGAPKQLLRVNDEPMLLRTLRQLDLLALGDKTTVVGTDALRRVIEKRPDHHLVTLKEPGYCILDGLSQVLPVFGRGPTLVLLGDVVFSNAAIWKIVAAAESKSLFFAGQPGFDRHGRVVKGDGELFAFGYHDPMLVDRLLESAPCRKIAVTAGQPGHLRKLLISTVAEKKDMRGIFVEISDWTNDIDTPDDIARRLPIMSAAAAEEADKPLQVAYVARHGDSPIVSKDPT